MNKYALVTGAAGFIGSHLSERLLDDGWIVTGIDSLERTDETGQRRVATERILANRNLKFIEGDLLRVDLADLVADTYPIFHLATRAGVRSSWEDFQWALNVAIAMIAALVDEAVDTQFVESSCGDPPRTGDDTSHLQEVSGWKPDVDLREGLSRQVDWYRSITQNST